MESGLRNGIRDGLGSPFGLSPMRNGLKNGFHQNNLPKKDKFQDFTILSGIKVLSGCAWLADYGVYNTSNNLSAMINQLTSTGISFAVNSDPNFNLSVFGNRKSIQFDAGDRLYTSSTTFLQGYNSQTVMMIIKLTGAGILYSYVDSTSLPTVGDLSIVATSVDRVTSTFIGNPTSTSSVIESVNPLGGNWFLLTVICDINEQTSVGQEMYINGQRIFNYTTKNFTPSTSTFTGVNGSFGNNQTLASGGNNYIAGGLVLPYAVNSSERIRLENFFRIYYGYQF
jgi:hypothetical protein